MMSAADVPSTEARAGSRRRIGALDAAGLGLGLLLAIPIASVCISIFAGPSPTFIHLAETVLSEYVVNTLTIVALVIAGVLAIGVPAAWLTSCCEFPGRRILEAALILPLAAPAYVLAYAYAGFLRPLARCRARSSRQPAGSPAITGFPRCVRCRAPH